MSKRLLRGIIDFGSGISQEALDANFMRLSKSQIEWVQPADEKLYRFVLEFFEREGDIPTALVMADFFKRKDDIETLERLWDIKAATPSDGAGFKFFLGEVLEEQRRIKLATLLKESMEVAQKGLVLEEGRKKTKVEPGVDNGIRHLEDHLDGLRLKPAEGRTRGDVRLETTLAMEDYARAKNGKAYGCFSGISKIDEVCWGAHSKQIWLHIGFTGEMKSTLAVNWCYHAVTRYRRNVVYVSIEMTREQIRNSIFAMHSAHPKFAQKGEKRLDYKRVKRGQLTPDEEQFYEDVLNDFENNREYCRFDVITPEGPYGMPQLRTDLNRVHREADIGLVVIDHVELMEHPSRDQNHGIRVNSTYLALRDLAKNYNDGEGLALLVLHQVNRQGKERAVKNGGRYDLSAISWANEAERSAHVVTAGWVDRELKMANQVRIQNLKNRDDPLFEDVTLDVHWPTKRLSVSAAAQEMCIDEEAWDTIM